MQQFLIRLIPFLAIAASAAIIITSIYRKTKDKQNNVTPTVRILPPEEDVKQDSSHGSVDKSGNGNDYDNNSVSQNEITGGESTNATVETDGNGGDNDTYMSYGMSLGMCIGTAVGCILMNRFGNIAITYGICFGMLAGLIISMNIKKR